MRRGKLIIFSAPSGSGKSTLINFLLKQGLNLELSVSATNRLPRGEEKHGREYFFLSTEDFQHKIKGDAFLEWEEVYPGRYYGTLKEAVENSLDAGINVLFDVDVVGACNIKKYYKEQALSLFVMPPSVEELEKRLLARNTDKPEDIAKRVAKAEYELTFSPQFDKIVINDNLEKAKEETLKIVRNFIEE